MSGTKTSRADLKNRFKKSMYPTEGDFANVFESYVHKDDDISMSKVVLTDGDGNTTTLNNVIGNKADKTDLTEITNRLTTAENDIDTAEDNIAGHETRIRGLEAFKERVRAFLEDADASEETINRWHEIESFLQGITDTQTLTGLLNDLKQEILQSIPQSQQGNYLQLIDDLDAYTDAPVGTIVKYTGPTNNKYTHGFDYEKVGGNEVSIPDNTRWYRSLDLYLMDEYVLPVTPTRVSFVHQDNENAVLYWRDNPGFDYDSIPEPFKSVIGSLQSIKPSASASGASWNTAVYWSTLGRREVSFEDIADGNNLKSSIIDPLPTTLYYAIGGDGKKYIFTDCTSEICLELLEDGSTTQVSVVNGITISVGFTISSFSNYSEAKTIGAPASWQPSKSMSVID